MTTENFIVSIEIDDNGSADDIKKAIKSINDEIAKMPGGSDDKEMQKLIAALNKYKEKLNEVKKTTESTTDTSVESLQEIGSEYSDLVKKSKQLTDELKKHKQGTKAYQDTAESLSEVNTKLDTMRMRGRAAIDTISDGSKEAGSQIKDSLGRAIDIAGGDLKDLIEIFTDGLGNAKDSVGNVSTSLTTMDKVTRAATVGVKVFGFALKAALTLGAAVALEAIVAGIEMLKESTMNFIQNTNDFFKSNNQLISENASKIQMLADKQKSVADDERKTIAERRRALLEYHSLQLSIIATEKKKAQEDVNDKLKNREESLKKLQEVNKAELDLAAELNDGLKSLSDEEANIESQKLEAFKKIQEDRLAIQRNNTNARIAIIDSELANEKISYAETITLLNEKYALQEQMILAEQKLAKNAGDSVKMSELQLQMTQLLIQKQNDYNDSLKDTEQRINEITEAQSDFNLEVKKSNDDFWSSQEERYKAALEQKQEFNRQIYDKTVKLQKKEYKVGIDYAKKTEAEKADLAGKTLGFVQSAVSNTGEAVAKAMEMSGASMEQQAAAAKAFAIGQSLINTALGITNVLATVPKADFGIMQTILIASVAAMGAAQTAAIAATPMATGGHVGRVAGTNINNTDKVPVMLHPSEVVLNPLQQKMLGGEATFGAIGVPGFTPPNVITSQAQSRIDSATMSSTPVYLSFSDFERQRNKYIKYTDSSKV